MAGSRHAQEKRIQAEDCSCRADKAPAESGVPTPGTPAAGGKHRQATPQWADPFRLGRPRRQSSPFSLHLLAVLPSTSCFSKLLRGAATKGSGPRAQALGLRPPGPAPAAPPPSSPPCSAAWTRGSPAGGWGGYLFIFSFKTVKMLQTGAHNQQGAAGGAGAGRGGVCKKGRRGVPPCAGGLGSKGEGGRGEGREGGGSSRSAWPASQRGAWRSKRCPLCPKREGPAYIQDRAGQCAKWRAQHTHSAAYYSAHRSAAQHTS